MTLNANHIRELLEHATPGPWEYKLEDGYTMSDLVEVLNGWIQTEDGETVMGTGLEINDEQELRNLALAALAPELAADWLRIRSDLGHLARVLEDFAASPDSAPADRFAARQLHKLLNGVTNDGV